MTEFHQMLELPNTTTVQGNGVRWGKIGQGPALIALHGTPFSSQVWRRIVPHLAAHWTVYYFDLVGYGQSEMRADQDVSLGVQNLVLAALMQEWGLTRPHVLAHDFGGATALRGHFLNGLSYASLTIFDAVALSPWGSPFVQHVRRHPEAFAGMPDYMHLAVLRAYLQTSAHHPLSVQALDIYAKPWMGPVGKPAFYRQIAQMDQKFTDEVQGQYRLLDCPVTVLWGERDNWIPPDKGRQLAALISAHPVIPIPNAGHLVQEDAPEALVAAMLRQCPPSAR
ncbi:alpha/beta hydrolase [Devosia sp. J2-20]|uniref:alpha/beta fold hydrolase n=1 Tax=Devosia sp. J2-20 TaxID=3026161 RepID=UPI00249CA041|nr:alpha/beta hydrolase [Devosia sp. J2-20]WDR00193.1 alpha/beta hydrolase [Devosia sp. J2-20]